MGEVLTGRVGALTHKGHVCVGQSLSNTAGCLQDSGENTTISVTFCFSHRIKTSIH